MDGLTKLRIITFCISFVIIFSAYWYVSGKLIKIFKEEGLMIISHRDYFLAMSVIADITAILVIIFDYDKYFIWFLLFWSVFSFAVYSVLSAIENAVNYLKKKEDTHVGQ